MRKKNVKHYFVIQGTKLQTIIIKNKSMTVFINNFYYIIHCKNNGKGKNLKQQIIL